MSAKKIFLVLTIFLVAAAGVTAYYFYNKLNRISHLPEYIPAEAESVFYLNAKMVFKQLVLKKDSVPGFSEFKTNPYIKSIQNIRETGIDFLSDAAFIRYKDVHYVLFVLDDTGKFEKTIQHMQKGLFGPIQQSGSFNEVRGLKDSMTLSWTRDRLVLIPKPGKNVTDGFIKEILNVNVTHNFSKKMCYVHAKKEDALVWFYLRKVNPRFLSKPEIKGFANWDSAFHVFATDHINGLYVDRSMPLQNSRQNEVYSDTGKGLGNIIVQILSKLHLSNEKNIPDTGLENYVKVFRLHGLKAVKNEIITYAYDENFNKKKTIIIKTDTINAASLYLYRPGKLVQKTFTNDTESDGASMPVFPSNIKFRACFNQYLFRDFNPLNLLYRVEFLQISNNGFNDYQLVAELKPFN